MNNYIKLDEKNRIFLENNEENILKYIDKKNDYYLNIFKDSKNKINFCALFFGPLWMGYRKMYFEIFAISCCTTLLGVLLIAYEFFSMTFISEAVINGFGYSLMGVMGVFGNYLYFLSLKRRIINANNKIGVSKIGILYGLILGIAMPLFVTSIFIFLFIY